MSNSYQRVYLIGSHIHFPEPLYTQCIQDVSCSLFDFSKAHPPINKIIQDRISAKTVFIAHVHGTLITQEHYMDINHSMMLNTKEFIFQIHQNASKPLHFQLHSCYSGNIDIQEFNAPTELVLTTTSNKDHLISSSINTLRMLFDYKHDNHTTPYHTFLHSIHINAASFAQFITNHGTFSLSPPLNVLLSRQNSKKYLELESSRFIEFSRNHTWDKKPIELTKYKVREERANLFSIELFVYLSRINDSNLLTFLEKNNTTTIYCIDELNSEGFSGLIMAIYEGNEEMTKSLLKAGANPNQARDNGKSPLIISVEQNNIDIATLLLKAGANPNQSINDELSPLTYAVKVGYVDIAALLLKYNANPNQANYYGSSPLLIALNEEFYGLAPLLLSYGADPNQASDSGTTPLIVSIYENHLDTVKLLLEYGANPNQINNDGESPLQIALEEKEDLMWHNHKHDINTFNAIILSLKQAIYKYNYSTWHIFLSNNQCPAQESNSAKFVEYNDDL